MISICKKWSGWRDSNSQPLAPKASALPIAPHPDITVNTDINVLIFSIFSRFFEKIGVSSGSRTHDPQNHNLMLYQLSYTHRIFNINHYTAFYTKIKKILIFISEINDQELFFFVSVVKVIV